MPVVWARLSILTRSGESSRTDAEGSGQARANSHGWVSTHEAAAVAEREGKEAKGMLEQVKQAVIEGDDAAAALGAQAALDEGSDPAAVLDALSEAIRDIGDRFQRGEAFLPEMMLAADAMKAGVAVVQPALASADAGQTTKGRVVIGTIQHDIHDIGKNIVATFLEMSGYEVHDLGRDVSPKLFVEKAAEVGADMVAVSVLLTSTMAAVPDVIEELHGAGLRERCRFIVGGAAVTQTWADEIGADGTAEDAASAAILCKELLS